MICIDMSNYNDLTKRAAQSDSLEEQLYEAKSELIKMRRERTRLYRRLSWVRRTVEEISSA
jgi:hypothetical protein